MADGKHEERPRFTLTITPNTPRISSIEVPGQVKGSGMAAVRALGGEALLGRCLGKRRDYFQPSIQGNMLRATSVAPSSVFLRVMPDDRFSKFLVSAVSPRSDILVRIQRKKQTREILSVTVVGRIVEKVSFETLADFYCMPPETSRSTTLDIEHEMDENVLEPLFVPPPVFTRLVVPLKPTTAAGIYGHAHVLKTSATRLKRKDAALHDTEWSVARHNNTTTLSRKNSKRDSSSDDQGEAPSSGHLATEKDTGKQSSTKGRSSIDSTVCNAVSRFDDHVPVAPPPIAMTAEVDSNILTAYKSLFETRAMWLRYRLDCAIGVRVSDWKRKPALARVCYYVSDGPWRGALCRFGYDPKADPESRRYQTIDFRDPFYRGVDWKANSRRSVAESSSSQRINLSQFVQFRPARLSTGRSSFTPNIREEDHGGSGLGDTDDTQNAAPLEDELCFRTPPSRPSVLYQFCDIDDPAIQKVLETSQVLQTCSKESGWYPKSTIMQIRDLMHMVCRQMRSGRRSEAARPVVS